MHTFSGCGRQAKDILDRYISKYGNEFKDKITIGNLCKDDDHIRGSVRHKNFFDEFDYYDRVFFDPKGYYCTTSHKLRRVKDVLEGTDVFSKLVRHSCFNYIQYPIPESLTRDVECKYYNLQILPSEYGKAFDEL